jgi:hypothetical protein
MTHKQIATAGAVAYLAFMAWAGWTLGGRAYQNDLATFTHYTIREAAIGQPN